MAARSNVPSASRRPGEAGQRGMTIGSFTRLEEIGRGSFATVYKAAYSVSIHILDAGHMPVIYLALFGWRFPDLPIQREGCGHETHGNESSC